jgi:hypothetical protein
MPRPSVAATRSESGRRRGEDAQRYADGGNRPLLVIKIELLQRRRPDVEARVHRHAVDNREEIATAQIEAFDRITQRTRHEVLWPAGIERCDLGPPIAE